MRPNTSRAILELWFATMPDESGIKATTTPRSQGKRRRKRTPMAAISREEVAHLARLSRLAVTEEELDRFAGQLDVILQSVARVGEVAAEDIPPTSHSVPLTNVYR